MKETFIRSYPKAFSDEFCDSIIDHFNWREENGQTWDRKKEANNLVKSDSACLLNPTSSIDFGWEQINFLLKEFNELFWSNYYASYCEEFSTLSNFSNHTIFSYKVQKTVPGGGYHVWHAESDCLAHSRRLGVYTVYLNDVQEGGETEFLYQNLRVPAEKGTLCIFPSSYTHTHRGNPPLSNTKYIMTGWIEFS